MDSGPGGPVPNRARLLPHAIRVERAHRGQGAGQSGAARATNDSFRLDETLGYRLTLDGFTWPTLGADMCVFVGYSTLRACFNDCRASRKFSRGWK